MNGTTLVSSVVPYSQALPGWSIRGTGDFDNDGKTDILWQFQDGSVYYWKMNGTTMVSGLAIYAQPVSGWTIRAAK